ncbi:unnamed protein product [Cylicostephanus goldi]|uniref:Uncharacterized protein n=1 Tax=Cylicostephanus goldi TaxID=71465 RepID=A0A3P6SVB0_CYLGO|nr:unnamed protein product [Cylicostephanus goldi]
METRGDGKSMPWSPDTKPRMGPRGMESEMGGRRHKFGGGDRFDGRHGSREGNRFSGRHRFEGGERFSGRHGSREGNRFNGKDRFGGEDHFNGGMMQRPMKNLRFDKK